MSGPARFGPQRQRHGVTKARVEGLGGLLVGAALVLLARSVLASRRQALGAGAGVQDNAGDAESASSNSDSR
jgi:hypothetical protein